MQVEYVLGNKDIVSVAIDIANEKHLVKLNQKEPLAGIIKHLCSEFNLAEDASTYALQFVHSGQECAANRYVTEENRHEIKDACILRLVLSPSEMVRLIISRIQPASEVETEEKHWALNKLANMSVDPLFAKMFHISGGLEIINSIITNNAEAPSNICFCLSALLCFMEHKLLLSLNATIIDKVVEYVISDKNLPAELLEVSLDILRKVSRDFKGKKDKPVNIGIPDIIQHIWNRDCPLVQEKALALVNTIAQSTEDGVMLNSMMSKLVRETVYQNVICNKVTLSMAHELYVYQTLILGILENRLKPLNVQGMDKQSIKEMNSILACIEEMQHRKDNMTFMIEDSDKSFSCYLDSAAPQHTRAKCFSVSGSKTYSNETLEKCPLLLNLYGSSKEVAGISHLTLDCILHFARRYRKTFIRVAMEEIALSPSFACTCEHIVALLCELLGIGKPPLADVTLYQPMVFTATTESPFMEELFCRALLLLGRTRREMKVRTLEDQEKVMQIIKRQLNYALLTKPETLEQLDCELKKVPYSVIKEMWWKEQQEKENWELEHSPPILQLKRENLTSLLELIRKQRLNVLTKGAKFPKYSARGQKVKKCRWFISLSSNLKVFRYGDCDEYGSAILESVNTFAVSNIRMLVTGRKCPHMLESRRRRQDNESVELAFSLLLKEEPQTLNFVAPDQTSFDLWTDGINVLLGNEMTSGTKEAELNQLMDIEVRLQLMDIEGVVIPHSPPAVPPEPLNYNFHYE